MRRLLLPLVAALAAVAVTAGTAVAGDNQNNNEQTSTKAYCAPTAGGTFVTSDEGIQWGLDYAVAHSGKIFVIEILPNGFAGVNEPGESLAQMFADGKNEDRLFLNNPDPHGLFGTSSVPITKGACPSAAFTAMPPRVAVCTAPMKRADGTIGAFQDIALSDWNTPGPYFHAKFANFAQGIGLTCDTPVDYHPSGRLVNESGNGDANSDPKAATGSGDNLIYPELVKAK